MTLFNHSYQDSHQNLNHSHQDIQSTQHKQATSNPLKVPSSRRSLVKAASLLAGIITMATTSALLSGCGGSKHGEDHEVYAVDKVEEAAELARANAPKPEKLKFEQTAAASAQATGAATATPATTETAAQGAEAKPDAMTSPTTSTDTKTDTTDASAKTDAGSTTDNKTAAEMPIVPESKSVLTGDAAQAADAAATAVQKAN